ncbi:uncharacterized protein BO66DRAFT_394824 [Aspergillus aculeatinus CBS 121060]|uniref:Uncharacterized protein n=1 Tax=Aspergillus aculeatinus CBS 121060 TaxID=1448322 RepID=A0ACD1GXW4_9EURO|nr:hypothetical protein BO66DRAFT_394824 [Aspergillus aculeatinus CBS 121060]RAH66116.1 hypothetical protein BO66DRAFT_394824 [Aspergillus aculeatinus CBS 121060]
MNPTQPIAPNPKSRYPHKKSRSSRIGAPSTGQPANPSPTELRYSTVPTSSLKPDQPSTSTAHLVLKPSIHPPNHPRPPSPHPLNIKLNDRSNDTNVAIRPYKLSPGRRCYGKGEWVLTTP